MHRITHKLKEPVSFDENCINCYGIKNHDEIHVASDISNKLGEFEDLEENLNIDLRKFVNHIFIEKSSTMYLKDVGDRTYWIKYGMIFVKVKGQEYVLRFEDYGNTWALTEEDFNEFSSCSKR